MKIRDRQGNIYKDGDDMEIWLSEMYSSAASRAVMKLVSSRPVSVIGARVLNSKPSALYIDRYAERHSIDLFDYEDKNYTSFNDFFTRKIKSGRRIIDGGEDTLVCPSDGKVSAYEIADSDMFVIKNSVYSVQSLLRDGKLAKKYRGGTAVIIRLTPDDYHRYIYPCTGLKSHNRKIAGALHSVRPTVNKYLPVYKENSREYCLLRSESFGDVVQMEVGATMVGKITNRTPEKARVTKGEEKGMFEFGGSTIILLLEADKVNVCADLIEATKKGFETKLRMGEIIGKSACRGR